MEFPVLECLQNMYLDQGWRGGGYTQNWLSCFGATDPESQTCSPSVPAWIPHRTDLTPGISVPFTLKHTAGKMDLIPQWLYALAPGNAWLSSSHRGRGGRQKYQVKTFHPNSTSFHHVLQLLSLIGKRNIQSDFFRVSENIIYMFSYPSLIQGFDLRRNSQGPPITPIPLTLSGTRRLTLLLAVCWAMVLHHTLQSSFVIVMESFRVRIYLSSFLTYKEILEV